MSNVSPKENPQEWAKTERIAVISAIGLTFIGAALLILSAYSTIVSQHTAIGTLIVSVIIFEVANHSRAKREYHE